MAPDITWAGSLSSPVFGWLNQTPLLNEGIEMSKLTLVTMLFIAVDGDLPYWQMLMSLPSTREMWAWFHFSFREIKPSLMKWLAAWAIVVDRISGPHYCFRTKGVHVNRKWCSDQTNVLPACGWEWVFCCLIFDMTARSRLPLGRVCPRWWAFMVEEPGMPPTSHSAQAQCLATELSLYILTNISNVK